MDRSQPAPFADVNEVLADFSYVFDVVASGTSLTFGTDLLSTSITTTIDVGDFEIIIKIL